ncbi:glycosyltransferase family 39 protein [Suhomyces tanzawaensis NRRL Y-17324]|uniref:Dolichyl-phosphate-mannose--protein mannosyltransferase n=1 Tax=Suhomyces tanzawaensis NRRL Y-17324 TaxID=984487 RepID=A0A1E4SMU0_9ASCO|nr:glycosyltransferase family 39 protein [Suhomyces tanzawaensis NRRL Y-17324]ODV80702.1 glycosyltransferase family 39 protein [Suhomyces tanzawaensis NRRL Y-17324]
MSQTLRKRGGKKLANSSSPVTTEDELDKLATHISTPKDPNYKYYYGLFVITVFATYTRFIKIGYPEKVVFDEVHFGKFASYYLERTYFFDLHPPFAKLLIAFVGWLVRYDGSFKFDNIGDSYLAQNVPYVAYRALLAIQGTAVVPLMYLTMKTLNFSVAACFFSSLLVCFDNAHVIDSRLILLDSTLLLSVALTIFSYAKFSTHRKAPFSGLWWRWLLATGVSLSCVISTKYVGVFTYVTIGIAVLHELWYLMDHKKGLTLAELSKHFFARLWALIIIPFVIYLFWFYVHFAILTKSGPGDSFMSSEFQETLLESPIARLSKDVHYYDIITIKHKDTDAFLHSHKFDYPLRYEDGRISSNTQQVTCVFDPDGNEPSDVNNHWEIVPANDNGVKSDVYTNDVIRLRHVGTGGYLLTHDVASPLRPTNEEFTIAYDNDEVDHYNETLFRLRYYSTSGSKDARKLVQTKGTSLKFIHVDTVVAMWTHVDELLPEWGFGHQEVSGNKKVQDRDNAWYIDEIVNLAEEDPRTEYVPKKVTTIPFLKKWWELQFLMFHHNNVLTSEHPFASQPDSWPLALSGVSFWNDNDEKKQIFFVGNVVGFWLEVCFLAIYLGLLLADQVTRRRNLYLVNDKARSKLYNTLGFLFIGWCAHYLPFFLMNRQKFLHHYLPAHLIAALFSGGLVEFITSDNSNDGLAKGVNKRRLMTLVTVCSVAVVWFFFYFRPVTYGDISLSPEEVNKRQWLDIKLHYAK